MHPLVARLTVEEKAALLSGGQFWSTAAVDRLDVAPVVFADGSAGVHRTAADANPLGLRVDDPTTAFPTAATAGSTWDPDLLEEMGRALGLECRAHGIDVLLGPGLNIKRSPLCGRNFEYLSEDPVLTGTLGAAWVRGVQSEGVGACVKHYAVDNQQTERFRVDAQVDEQTTREIYLPAFEQVVTESSPATVMSAHTQLNGVRATENRWLLTDVLRDEWDFAGYVVSDWGAVGDPARALTAGLDLAMPDSRVHATTVLTALANGTLTEADLDRAVSRILSVHDRLRAGRGTPRVVDPDAHHELARRVAVAGAVLLVNDGDLLPLAPTAEADGTGPIALIGEFARTPRFQGAGASAVAPGRLVHALEAVRAATDRPVTFAAGFRIDDPDGATPEVRSDDALVSEAVAIAREADVVVLFLGLPDADEPEGADRLHLALPAAQLALLDRVLEVNARVVVVLSNGSVVDLSPLVGRVPAILEMWLGGQACGQAVADVLLGAAEPGGRLAETVPRRLEDTPAFINWPGTAREVLYGERIYVGYRWYDRTDRTVAFPFGHGLGYTTIAVTDVEVPAPDLGRAHAVVTATVTNTGSRRGSEVVQVYVGDEAASVDRPVRELKAFTKVALDPGESRRVHLDLGERAFAFWGSTGWTVEPGTFRIEVGTSSRRIVARHDVELTVPARTRDLDGDSTLAEWLADPGGRPVLDRAISAADADVLDRITEDPEVLRRVAALPLRAVLGLDGTHPAPDPGARG